jgi:diacylglycerol kinase (ATP)
MNLLKMLRSFKFAYKGILTLIRQENNAKFHLLITVIVLLSGVYVKLSTTEWAIILTQIGIVWAVEAINTAIEKLCNFVSPEHQFVIGKVKDLAAAAVLIVAIVAGIVGILVFLPKII